MLRSDLLYLAQYELLLVWLESLDEEDLSRDSSLPGWSVSELIAHLCGSAGAIEALEALAPPELERKSRTAKTDEAGGALSTAPPDISGDAAVGSAEPIADEEISDQEISDQESASTDIDEAAEEAAAPPSDDSPLSVADYVAQYRGAAAEVAQFARDIAVEESVQAGIDIRKTFQQANFRALATLDRLGGADLVVRARRGPMMLSSFLDTRVIELVVHSIDLHRSLPDRPSPPVLASARSRVVSVLREVLAERAQDPAAALRAASALSAEEFITVATGRDSADALAPALAEALPLL